jgi:hypothetical protein
MRVMDTLDWIGAVLVLVGILTRLATWRRYVDSFAAAYGSAPPRAWLLARDTNPEVERARLPLALGTVVAVVGIVVFMLGVLAD